MIIFPTDVSLMGSEFHRVGVTTKKALVPTIVLALGTKTGFELDDRSCLSCLADVSSEDIYAGCLDER